MRGHYFDNFSGKAISPSSQPPLTELTLPEPESDGDRNARQNAAKQAAGEGPTIIIGPDSAPTYEDARAIVERVALQVLLNELDYHGLSELAGNYFAELEGLSEDTIRRAIEEGLE